LALMVPGLVALRDRRTIQPPVPPRPDPPAIPPPVRTERRNWLPAPGSAARQPMRALVAAEGALTRLVRELRDAQVPADVVEEAWQAATNTAARLRAIASSLESVELAAKYAPPSDRAALTDGAAGLLTRLDDGLDGYRRLIAAAGRVLLAGVTDSGTDDLVEATEATEALSALAEALAELERP
jgi:hypothetical protein